MQFPTPVSIVRGIVSLDCFFAGFFSLKLPAQLSKRAKLAYANYTEKQSPDLIATFERMASRLNGYMDTWKLIREQKEQNKTRA